MERLPLPTRATRQLHPTAIQSEQGIQKIFPGMIGVVSCATSLRSTVVRAAACPEGEGVKSDVSASLGDERDESCVAGGQGLHVGRAILDQPTTCMSGSDSGGQSAGEYAQHSGTGG